MIVNICCLILGIGAAVFYIMKYRQPIYSMKNDIEAIFTELKVYSQDEYTQKYEEINEKLSKNNTLNSIWRDFSKSLTKQYCGDNKYELFSSTNAEEFFSFDNITKNMNMSFWQNYGGTFTGLGILGTFAGLTAGLWGMDISNSDINVLKEGISGLLSGIYAAFVTSLGGITVALIFNFYHKNTINKLEKSINELSKQIDDMYPRYTMEKWLSMNYQENKEQTKVLKNLSADMAYQLGEILDNQLSNGFDELCDKLEKQMKPTFDKLYTVISELSSGGVSAIAGVVSEQAGTQLKSFADSLDEMQKTMKLNLEASQRVTEETNHAVMATVEALGKALTQGANETANKQKETMEHMATQINQLVDSMNDNAVKSMKDMLTTSNIVQNKLEESVHNTQISIDGVVQGFTEMSKQQEGLIQKHIDGTQQQLNSTLESTKEQFESMMILLQKTLEDHNKSVGQTYNQTENIIDTINNLLVKIKETGSDLEGSVIPIREASNQLKEEIIQTRNETQKVHEDIEKQLTYSLQTEKNIKSLKEHIELLDNCLTKAWQHYQANFENVSGELEQATEIITDKLSKYNDMMNVGMQKQLNSFDDSVSKVIGDLSALVEELNDSVDDFIGRIEKYEKENK